MDHSRVTSDLRHMVDAGKCETLSLLQELARFTGVPPFVACLWPRSSSPPTPQPGPHLNLRLQKHAQRQANPVGAKLGELSNSAPAFYPRLDISLPSFRIGGHRGLDRPFGLRRRRANGIGH